jgi:hypothetical protein
MYVSDSWLSIYTDAIRPYDGPRSGLPKQKTADPAGPPYDLWLYLKLAGQGRQRVTNNSLS